MIGRISASRLGRGRFGLLAPLAIDPLAVVVELGGGAQQTVLQAVALGLQRLDVHRLGGLVGGRPARPANPARRCSSKGSLFIARCHGNAV